MDAFDELGRTIHGKWRRADFDNRAFPEIACDALHAWDLPGRITYDDVIDWVAEADVLPTQTDLAAAFGQPSGGRVLRFTLFYRGVVLDQRHDRRSPALVLGRLYRALRVERSEPVPVHDPLARQSAHAVRRSAAATLRGRRRRRNRAHLSGAMG